MPSSVGHPRTRLVLALLALLSLARAPQLGGQVISGEIDGKVTNLSGALVPGATLTITDLSTKRLVRTVTSNSHGEYTAALLPVGTYSITITAPGFQKTTIDSVVVNVGENETSNAILQPGSV